MALIYGSGFKPSKIYTGEVKDREKKTASDTALFVGLRVLTSIAFIALTFIPVAGEVGEAALLSAEGATEAALEASASASEIAALTSTTARSIRLGDTIKGSIGLGLAEAGVNEALDRIEGTQSSVNSAINFALAFTPAIGALKGRRTSNIRFAQNIDKQIIEQQKILKLASTASERAQIEQRIRQLKNAKLVRNKKMFSAPIDSATVSAARKETLNMIQDELKHTNKLYVKSIAKDLQTKLETSQIKLSKHEARVIVRNVTRGMPSVSEGVTIQGLVESKWFNNTTNILRKLDPNLAARQFWTAAARKLTSNEALIVRTTKDGVKEYGKWLKKVNLGYYKRFGKKLSKWWRKHGIKIYKHSRLKMIPVTSKWIEGYRLIDTPIPGEYIMIVIFKPSKSGSIHPPVVVNPVTLPFVEEFATGGIYNSVGSFYINRIALARNGSGPSIVGSLSSILGPLSLGTFRKILSGPAALERLIRKVTKGDYFQTFFDNIVETSNRLYSHKIGKVIAGRWGIAIARGMQSTKKGHTVYLKSPFDIRHIIEEMGVVTLDKARSVQRKAGIFGRTQIIQGKRVTSQWQRTIKLMTFGHVKFDGKRGFKKGKSIF